MESAEAAVSPLEDDAAAVESAMTASPPAVDAESEGEAAASPLEDETFDAEGAEAAVASDVAGDGDVWSASAGEGARPTARTIASANGNILLHFIYVTPPERIKPLSRRMRISIHFIIKTAKRQVASRRAPIDRYDGGLRASVPIVGRMRRGCRFGFF